MLQQAVLNEQLTRGSDVLSSHTYGVSHREADTLELADRDALPHPRGSNLSSSRRAAPGAPGHRPAGAHIDDLPVGLGFRPLGELGIPQRWAFKEPARLAGTNTYVIVDGWLSLRNHLRVRETLRSNVALREEYAATKMRVGVAAADIDEYGQAKNALVQRLLAAGGMSDEDRASIAANQVPAHEQLPR